MSDIPVIYLELFTMHFGESIIKNKLRFFFGIPDDESQRSSWNSVAKKKSPLGRLKPPPTFLWCFFWIREIPNFFVFFLGNCKKLAKCHDSPELFGECLYSESSFLPLLHTNLHSPHNARASQEFSGRLSLHVVARTALLSGDPLPLLSARHLWQYVPWQNIKFSRDL